MPSYSPEFKRNVALEALRGSSMRDMCRHLGVARNSITAWIDQYQAGAFDDVRGSFDHIQELKAQIASLERLAGKQAMEIEFLKGALSEKLQSKNVNTSVIIGPTVSRSAKDAS
ncbi:MAG: transposase [Micropepsaceae bacterium]